MSLWSAHDLPMTRLYIYRGPPSKCAKKFVLVNFFRFSKNREKSQKTQRKNGFLCHFLLIKSAFFLKRSSQKCIIKTIISYTTNAQFFHWKTVRKCLHTNAIHLHLFLMKSKNWDFSSKNVINVQTVLFSFGKWNEKIQHYICKNMPFCNAFLWSLLNEKHIFY